MSVSNRDPLMLISFVAVLTISALLIGCRAPVVASSPRVDSRQIPELVLHHFRSTMEDSSVQSRHVVFEEPMRSVIPRLVYRQAIAAGVEFSPRPLAVWLGIRDEQVAILTHMQAWRDLTADWYATNAVEAVDVCAEMVVILGTNRDRSIPAIAFRDSAAARNGRVLGMSRIPEGRISLPVMESLDRSRAVILLWSFENGRSVRYRCQLPYKRRNDHLTALDSIDAVAGVGQLELKH